ncbi:MAG TPA: hypothetical protein VJT81_04765 [Burkholderiales bacterium]|nr:hypothetical protein [Burkholderiales bacterium]
MMNTSKDLLEAYLEAKDRNRPHLILESHTPNAILTYSIATDTISFPSKVMGADAIAQTLVRDFRKTFDRCKTYYVCDSIVDRAPHIDFVPWLVIMREMSNSALRVGKGYYRWQFEFDGTRTRVCAMHIHIERMDHIEDRAGNTLNALQSELPYPWLPPATLLETFERLMKQAPGFAFLEAFKAPIGKQGRTARPA